MAPRCGLCLATADLPSARAGLRCPVCGLALPPMNDSKGLATQGTKFLITGVISAVVDFSLTLLFQEWVGLSKFFARTIGFIFGTLTAYMINRRWTFQAAPSGKRLTQVIILYALTYIINAGGYKICAEFLENYTDPVIASTIAFVIAQGTATVINFFVQRIFIFKVE